MSIFGIDILNGLTTIGVIYLGFSVVYLLNMIGGAIINCQIAKVEEFSFKQILISLEKVLFCGIVMGGLVIATNLVTQGLFEVEEEMSKLVTSVVSIGVFALVFAKGFIQKALNLMDKVKYLLEISDTSPAVDLDAINEMTVADFYPELEPDYIEPAEGDEGFDVEPSDLEGVG